MSRALQVYYSAFDDVFLHLSDEIRRRIEAEIDAMACASARFPTIA